MNVNFGIVSKGIWTVLEFDTERMHGKNISKTSSTSYRKAIKISNFLSEKMENTDAISCK